MYLAPILLAISASGPVAPDLVIPQIDIDVVKARIAAQKQIAAAAKASVGVTQLPSTLEPKGEGMEDSLVSRSTPASSLTADVIQAWTQIRQRGQTPTPDLIAREIGPGKLAEFLASSPAAASILATGSLPDAPREEADPPKGAVTVIPSGGV